MDGRSAFVVRVYQELLADKYKFVASLADTIDGVLEKLKDGGTKPMLLATRCTDVISTIKCLKKNLKKIPQMGPIIRR